MNSRKYDRWTAILGGSRWVFAPDRDLPWCRSHAQAPIVSTLPTGDLRCWYTSRDHLGRSHVGWVDIDPVLPYKFVRYGTTPSLEPGRVGAFDDSGVMASSIVVESDTIYMYYVGWNRASNVPYRLSIGRVRSDDLGKTFVREFDGPILDRSRFDPFGVTMPSVERLSGGAFRMVYSSLLPWRQVGENFESAYALKEAWSLNGFDWIPANWFFGRKPDSDRASVRPTFFLMGETRFVCYSERAYSDFRHGGRSAYALFLGVEVDGAFHDAGPVFFEDRPIWANEMFAYPCVWSSEGKHWLFFNGNGFGSEGFGVAQITVSANPG